MYGIERVELLLEIRHHNIRTISFCDAVVEDSNKWDRSKVFGLLDI